METLRVLKAWQVLQCSAGTSDYRIWEQGLADMTGDELRRGLRKTRDFVGFFHLPAFRNLCRVSAEDLGLPSASEAFQIALVGGGNRAVQEAVTRIGHFDLSRMSSSEARRRFTEEYAEVCREIIERENAVARLASTAKVEALPRG